MGLRPQAWDDRDREKPLMSRPQCWLVRKMGRFPETQALGGKNGGLKRVSGLNKK